VNALHRSTVVRTLALSAGFTLVLYALAVVLGPALVELSSESTSRVVVLLAGLAVRVVAGRIAARPAWDAGADIPLLLASAAVGGLIGWLVFPGALSLIGLVAEGSGLGSLVSLLFDLVLWVVCVAAGALSWRLRAGQAARA
jgi:hypothetical protein